MSDSWNESSEASPRVDSLYTRAAPAQLSRSFVYKLNHGGCQNSTGCGRGEQPQAEDRVGHHQYRQRRLAGQDVRALRVLQADEVRDQDGDNVAEHDTDGLQVPDH